MATLIKIDRNGSKHWQGEVECDRCSGKGIYYIGSLNGRLLPSYVDNGVCFKCGGSGKVIEKWIERTPEYQAKLDAKRQAKWDEISAKAEAERKQRESEEAKRKEEEARKEAEREAQKKISQYVGAIGDKIDLDLTYDHSACWEQPSYAGFGITYMNLHCFRDDNGNLLVWKTESCLSHLVEGTRDTWISPESGDKVHVKGTIKAFTEYKGEKQTQLLRCKVTF